MNTVNDLRLGAEVVLREKSLVPPDLSTLPNAELQKLVYELQVHQVELEMQNQELQAAQIALQESLNKYIDLYDFAPMGYLTVDRKGFVLNANLTAANLLGLDRDSLIGKTLYRFLSKEDSDILYLTLKRILQTREKRTCELRIAKENGEQIYVQLEGIAPQKRDGKVARLRILLLDISARKRSEEGVLTHVEEIEDLYNNAPCGYHSLDKDGVFVRINNTELSWLGYTRDELIGKIKFSDILTPESLVTFQKNFPGFKERGWVKDLEFELVRKDGAILPVILSSTAIKDSAGNYHMSRSTVFDIAKRKLAEEESRSSEERFRAIFEGAEDFIFIKDLSLRYTHVNPATTKLLGVPASEVLGKRAEDIFDSQSALYIGEIDTRVLTGERIEEISVKKIKGIPITFHEVRTPMHDGSGKIIGVCGISRDVTDLTIPRFERRFEPQEYRSEIMRTVLEQASFAASGKSVILLLGESGAGKDYLARYIHERSSYSSGRFFSINCAAVPSDLAESELFGHEAGAFTGAGRQKRGLLELAEGGTLLLNEIGELSPALQAKLLTFLDTRTFTRVGGEKKITVNARILAATNRDLEQDISKGRFRSDLYYRLNVFSLRMPPLRERMEDLPILVAELLSILAKELQMSFTPELTAGEMAKLYNYHWPGNIRELRNVLERAIILSGRGTIRVDIEQRHEGVSTSTKVLDITGTSSLADSVENLSRSMIEEALTRSKGKKELAASFLGVSRYALRRRIKKLGLDVRD